MAGLLALTACGGDEATTESVADEASATAAEDTGAQDPSTEGSATGDSATDDPATDSTGTDGAAADGAEEGDTASDGAAEAPASGAAPPAAGGSVSDELLAATLGPTDDVSAAVAGIGPFPALATAPGAEIIFVGGQTRDNGFLTTERVLVRYLTSIDPNELQSFFDTAAQDAGWTALPIDDSSYGGSSSLFVGLYDRPGVDMGEGETDFEVAVESTEDGRSEVTLFAIQPTSAADPWSRFTDFVAAIPVPEGQLGLSSVEFSSSTTSDGVRSSRSIGYGYAAEAAALQDQVLSLVGEPSAVTPAEPGPGQVEVQGLGGFDLVRYESGPAFDVVFDGAVSTLLVIGERAGG